MFITIDDKSGPITCSKCGSMNAVKPLNQPEVLIRCQDCGHEAREHAGRKAFFDELMQSASHGTQSRRSEKITF